MLYDGEEAELHVRKLKGTKPGVLYDPCQFWAATLKIEEKVWNQIFLMASDFFTDES